MRKLLAFLLALAATYATAQSATGRVVPNDPATYRELSAVHAGAGTMGFTQLVGRNDLSSNFLYLHTGVIHPKSGIGHHFHHTIEEMYVILDGEAQFTINGRTSTIAAPAVVPCKLGDAHAIYNASDQPLRWLNFAVSQRKAQGDAFDLGDDRTKAELDPVPVFVSRRLERDELKKDDPAYEGTDIAYRRVLGPEVFRTDWDHVDHMVIPAGGTTGPRTLEGQEEVYYVINGTGTATVGEEKVDINADDAFYGKLGEKLTIANGGQEELELLAVGIAPSKEKRLGQASPSAEPQAMVLQMDFVVEEKNTEAFEKMYHSVYVPAMTVQDGYLSSKLLRLFPEPLAQEIEAEATTYNYQIQISFDTEENRRKWVASEQHQIAWPAASSLAKEYKWRGYDVMGDDDQR